MIPPSVPKEVMAVTDTGKVIINWSVNPEKDIMGYRIYRTVNKDDKTKYVLINALPIKETTFTDILPKKAKNNFLYCVVAVDSAFNLSDYSIPVKVRLPDVTPPMQPYIKNITQVNNTLYIEWEPNVEFDLLGYSLFKKEEAIKDGEWEKVNVNRIPPSARSYKDRSVASDVRYIYKMMAQDSSLNESIYSKEMRATYREDKSLSDNIFALV